MIAIVKYNAGNIFSVLCAVKRLGYEAVVTDDPEILRTAEKVIFPGVGEARAAMEYLNKTGLAEVIRSLQQPVLGICIGMQLLCRHSEEGDVDCLGIFDVDVIRFCPENQELKVPQVGWNQIFDLEKSFFAGSVNSHSYVYFVHSYYAPICNETIAKAEYGIEYSAALHSGNFYATQFHPEKSGSIGEKILMSFLEL